MVRNAVRKHKDTLEWEHLKELRKCQQQLKKAEQECRKLRLFIKDNIMIRGSVSEESEESVEESIE